MIFKVEIYSNYSWLFSSVNLISPESSESGIYSKLFYKSRSVAITSRYSLFVCNIDNYLFTSYISVLLIIFTNLNIFILFFPKRKIIHEMFKSFNLKFLNILMDEYHKNYWSILLLYFYLSRLCELYDFLIIQH